MKPLVQNYVTENDFSLLLWFQILNLAGLGQRLLLHCGCGQASPAGMLGRWLVLFERSSCPGLELGTCSFTSLAQLFSLSFVRFTAFVREELVGYLNCLWKKEMRGRKPLYLSSSCEGWDTLCRRAVNLYDVWMACVEGNILHCIASVKQLPGGGVGWLFWVIVHMVSILGAHVPHVPGDGFFYK